MEAIEIIDRLDRIDPPKRKERVYRTRKRGLEDFDEVIKN